MTPKIDIHVYESKYKAQLEKLGNAQISDKNKNLIREFDHECFLQEALGKPRRIKLIGALTILAQDYFRKDFDKVTERDIKDALLKIENKDYSAWTKQSYKSIVKKFYKWQVFGNGYSKKLEYPPIVSWINTTLRKKDKPKVQAGDILTEKEVKKLIDVAEHPRDKAFLALLYELGARIGELGGLRIKDVNRDKYSYIVDLQGKTGHRTPRIVISDPFLTSWLNIHPFKDNPEAPLWIMLGNRDKDARMRYAALRGLLTRVVERSGIKKRVYPHLFRHSRVTHLLMNHQINESQAKIYFGWTPDTKMLSEYSHLLSHDVNETILEMHGIKSRKEVDSEFKPKQCQSCQTVNNKDALFCQKCSKVLDVKAAIALDDQRKGTDNLMTELVKDPEVQKILVKKIVEMGLAEQLFKR